ncbi:adenine phosphoribosyltransferase [Mycoplasmopsis canis UFG4]|uniref:Adenine phosphoribosyltransferase n=1 Tax=Mycoplasmopsis canis UFG4 TaxID=1131455 RepID=I1A6M2_9BACT|nr:adenine phosphoribosyltransferase [Mycoplasmopsis canis]EIE40665.1 adenine phosphoribosyltransferase [Mycoplasmopsis canis UF33]EIE41947.1 adenine phosphoribosyltransferase [Mycoplasmopsis canis UFG1]EIE42143.1 adenine phosphoribosyltransferase [Mycoplasmopsis canis UFG4]WQQ12735.1 adenine phosphoribosyltransferase [Mycoplasmopsis canis]
MDISKLIRDVKDFPKKGIIFKDISPLLANGEALNYTINKIVDNAKDADIIVGPDARGFLFGTPAAAFLKKPFIMVRKPHKLPGEVISMSYDLEYGSNVLEIQKGFVKSGQKAVIVDDVLATGGTTKAIIKLLESQGVEVTKVIVLLELSELKGRELIGKNIEIISLVKV